MIVFDASALISAALKVDSVPERALLRAAFRPPQSSVERLVVRLRTLFPEAAVDRQVQLRAASTHAWTLDALVTTEAGRAAFDIVTPHPTSVAFATAKFHDIDRQRALRWCIARPGLAIC